MNNKTTVLFLLCFFFAHASMPAMLTLKPETLTDKAERQGFGYKAANLMVLKNFITKLSTIKKTTDYTVQIPEFAVISSHEVQQFLRKKSGLALKKSWKKLLQKYSPAARNQFIESKKFSSNFLHDLKTELEQTVARLFTKNKSPNTVQDFFVGFKQQTRNELHKVIQAAKALNKKLVVRSTGKEDTESLANAGGNNTVLNVEPTVCALVTALTNVVASYFCSRSLIQRLNAGDPTLFDAPFTPVLVQLMISEEHNTNEPSNITRCGVMFTEEPEGATSKNMRSVDGKLGPTSSITLIQASYGLNEGVVNSTVPVDTFYVDETGITHAVIRKKNFRLVPSSTSGNTEQQLNPIELIEAPALQQPAITALKLLATALENFYQKPMDVEFVIDDAKKIIYIVQARHSFTTKQLHLPATWTVLNYKAQQSLKEQR